VGLNFHLPAGGNPEMFTKQDRITHFTSVDEQRIWWLVFKKTYYALIKLNDMEAW